MIFQPIGLRTSLWANNIKSLVLITLLPTIISALIWSMMVFWLEDINLAHSATLIGLILVALWFFIAFMCQEKLTMAMVNAKEVERRSYPELYNLTENLSIAAGIQMPKLYMMDSQALNAFASGMRLNHASICVTRGLVEKLNRQELEAVLAHEISHILHRDARVMTITILFVSIIAFLAEYGVRSVLRQKKSKEKGGPALFIVIGIAVIGYVIAILSKFAISRKREYMADAGSVVLTKDKEAMISALTKISGHSHLEEASSDMRFMLFDNTQSYLGLFDTHPSIEKRIEALHKY